MRNCYVFDVDGTLTPSRGIINNAFKEWLMDFAKNNKCYLVTGSDKPKTVEQIGEDLYDCFETAYQCSGNQVFKKNVCIRESNWALPKKAYNWLDLQLISSKFYKKTGNHFEQRTGMLNYSIVGRKASIEERAMYVEWDEHKLERQWISEKFNILFPELNATVAGETGLDIYPVGKDKAQIIDDFEHSDVLWFFGDKMEPGGNDHTLKKAIMDNDLGWAISVEGWEDTWNKLQLNTYK